MLAPVEIRRHHREGRIACTSTADMAEIQECGAGLALLRGRGPFGLNGPAFEGGAVVAGAEDGEVEVLAEV